MNSSVVPEAVNVLTYVSSSVIVTGAEMISVSVAVAVGATVLKMVMKPVEEATVVESESEGAPPEGSTTMVPGSPVIMAVMLPSPAVTVMMLPAEEDDCAVPVTSEDAAVIVDEAVAVKDTEPEPEAV